MRRILLALLALAAFSQALQAQIRVGLSIRHRLYIMYEPIIATITVTNLSGRDLPLSDEDGQPWFGFEIIRDNGQPVAPLDPNYQLTPLIIPAGKTVKRSVNLNALYPVRDFGLYRVRANIYFSPLKRYFQSAAENVEISEGKIIWQQVVGVPDGEKGAGGTRKITLLTFRRADSNYLYARVEDNETGAVFCTYPLGRLVGGVEPQIELDVLNRLHVLQVVGPKVYLYTRIGTDGEWLGQSTWLSVKTRPALKRDSVGEIAIRGGQLQEEPASTAQTPQGGPGTPPAGGTGVPKLSDRPANLPQD